MAYACQYDVPTDERTYQQVKSLIGDDSPAGLVLHLVVNHERGLRHTTIWESRDDWERFRAERVQPAVDKVLTGAGFSEVPPRPVEVELQVVDLQVG
ncbi:MAG TPA: hypothetical protein VM386_06000 [Acidimicrobiales bacterium]|nr:hypothetical protein [Acidimicrobiales bacterium]